MAGVRVEGITKQFGRVLAVNDLTLEFEDGRLTVLVGPSGCGKTTLLRLIAGLEDASDGSVYIAGREVSDVPPWRRNTAMVFQSYALYPHMSVFDNLAYPLKARGVASRQIKDRVERTASSLGISELLGRKPRELSGGQMQRVALGRAIVRTPEVFLMDEPLSNLDAKLRVEMRAELKRLQRDLGVTTIYVTHDQAEAMTMADTLIVMRDGRVQQAGSPEDLYLRPATLFVAGFIGSPAMNLIDCRYVSEKRALTGPSFSFGLSNELTAALNRKETSDLVLGIRPEDLAVHLDASEGEIAARVYMSEPLGRENLLTLEMGGMMVKALVSPELHVRLDQPVWLAFDERRIHLFDRQTEQSISIQAE